MPDRSLQDPHGWMTYLGEVERLAGVTITEGPLIDMLYECWLCDVSASVAVRSMPGMKHASVAVDAALAQIEAVRRQREITRTPVVYEGQLWPARAGGLSSRRRRLPRWVTPENMLIVVMALCAVFFGFLWVSEQPWS